MATGHTNFQSDSLIVDIEQLEIDNLMYLFKSLKSSVRMSDISKSLIGRGVLSAKEWELLKLENSVGRKIREVNLTEAFLLKLIRDRKPKNIQTFREVLKHHENPDYTILADKLGEHLKVHQDKQPSITDKHTSKQIPGDPEKPLTEKDKTLNPISEPDDDSNDDTDEEDGTLSYRDVVRMLKQHDEKFKRQEQENGSMLHQISLLRCQLAEKQLELDKLRNVQRELTAMKRQVSQLTIEREHTLEELIKERKTRELYEKAFTQERDSWEREKTILDGNVDTARTENKTLQKELEEKERVIAGIKKRIEDMTNPTTRSNICVVS